MAKGCFCLVVGLFLCLPFVGFAAGRIINDILFDRNLGGYLKRAADANSVELAVQELEIAVKYMEANRITEGYTSIIYTTPDEDVGFWYSNIKVSLDQLKALPAKAAQGEKDMALLKLRQTLLDHNGGKEVITCPAGISVFPYNTIWAIFGCLAIFLALASLVVLVIGLEISIDLFI